MIKVESFRKYYNFEEELAEQIENFLNTNSITRENIVDIKYAVNDDWIYCMLIWEDN